MKLVGKAILGLSVVALLFGCKGKEKSATTGWNLDDPKWGGWYSSKAERSSWVR